MLQREKQRYGREERRYHVQSHKAHGHACWHCPPKFSKPSLLLQFARQTLISSRLLHRFHYHTHYKTRAPWKGQERSSKDLHSGNNETADACFKSEVVRSANRKVSDQQTISKNTLRGDVVFALNQTIFHAEG